MEGLNAVVIKKHRGIYRSDNTQVQKQEHESVEFQGNKLQDLLGKLDLDLSSIGMVIVNGRVAVDFEKTIVHGGDKIELYPHLMGG